MIEADFKKSIVDFLIGKHDTTTNKISCIIVCGSHATNLAISCSDIDMIIVCYDGLQLSNNKYLVEIINNTRIEALVLTETDYCTALHRITNLESLKCVPSAIDYYIHSIPIYHEENYLKLRHQFSVLKYRDWISQEIENKITRIFEDIIGAFKSEQYDLVIYWTRSLICNVADQFLINMGDFYIRPKWISRRVKRAIGDTPLYKDFMNVLLNSPDLEKKSIALWLDYTLSICRNLQSLWMFKNEILHSSDDEIIDYDSISILVKINKNYYLRDFNSMKNISENMARAYLNFK